MFFPFHTIKSKLLFSFFMFLCIVGFMVVIDLWFDLKEERIQKILHTLKEINLEVQIAEKQEYIFLKDEIINPGFYETEISRNLENRKTQIQKIKVNFSYIKNAPEIRHLSRNIDHLIQLFDAYEIHFSKLIGLIKKRGFKGYGIEGEMRKHIHEIEREEINNKSQLVKLLMIRRHEKDFIIRKQQQYIHKLIQVVKDLRHDIQQQTELVKLLDAYESAFLQLAQIEKKIGVTNQTGAKGQLNEIGKKINSNILQLNTQINYVAKNVRRQNNIIQFTSLAISILLIIFLGYLITKILSKPISSLSSSIHQVIENNFSSNIHFARFNSKDELGMLSQDVSYMINQVQNNLAEIQEQNQKVERKHQLLMNGVNYAKRIQQAILPDYYLSESLKKYYVFYRPQYDVAGDLYWFTEKNESSFLAVVDCTGKGVAGAFMSMISHTLLNHIINEKQLNDPAFILETLNTEFRLTFNQNKNMSDDSMEICLCRLDHPTRENPLTKVTFAGANRPLLYSNGWEILEIKGTKRSIGGKKIYAANSFENHEIELKKGDFLYLTTDGLVKQVNKEREKYGTLRLKDFFKRVIHLPVKAQEAALREEIDRFMGGSSQRDDMTVFTLKI